MVKVLLKYGHSNIIYLAVIAMFIISCTKENDEYILKGDIEGQVALAYSSCHPNLSEDYSNIKVILEDKYSSYETFTDINGDYSFHDIPIGSYNVLFEKDSFCQEIIQSLQFIGGEFNPYQIPIKHLLQKNYSRIDSLHIENNESSAYSFNFSGIFTPDSTSCYKYFQFFVSSKSNVDYDKYEYEFIMLGSSLLHENNCELDSSYFSRGTKVYFIGYPISSSYYIYTYTDIETGKKIYTTLNKEINTERISYVIPK